MNGGDLLIGGRWWPGGGAPMGSRSPVDDALVWEGRSADRGQVDAAMRAAAAAGPAWAAAPLADRVALVRRFADLVGEDDALRDLMMAEVGKVRWDADAEVAAVVGKAEVSIAAHDERTGTSSTELAAGTLEVVHRANGPTVVLGPFNFPAHLANGHIMPALIAGDTVVLKPSELAPATSELVARTWERAGAPPGVVNLVHGGVEVAEALVDHPHTAAVLFTGSVGAGRAIHRRLAGRPEVLLALEMGGNNPLIVWSVEDPVAAARVVARSAYTSAGQRCTCARRLVVPDGPEGDAVVDAVAAIAERLRLGRPADEPPPFLGPVVSADAARRVLTAQDRLVEAGAELVVGARSDPLGPAFVRPGLVDVTAVADRPDEEVFGPLLQIVRVADVDAALAEANATAFGLAAGVLTDDDALWDRLRPLLRAGIVNRNVPLVGASGRAPFGGVGASGNHRPAGSYAADNAAHPVASLLSDAIAAGGPLPGVDDDVHDVTA
ncbi:MAG: succinylglutamate-semialdehyde dehydrogenase [Actinomycetota bacterium]|nr:succinylglutamate-semialdehyde dehydrogenase [Actinomycetota bacterium]